MVKAHSSYAAGLSWHRRDCQNHRSKDALHAIELVSEVPILAALR